MQGRLANGDTNKRYGRLVNAGKVLGVAGLLLALFIVSQYNYLLFHTIVEVFGVIIAGTIFLLGWNSRRLTGSGVMLFIGIAFLFMAGIKVLHLLSYKGMNIFTSFPGANLATQLWLAERYMLSLSLLALPFFLKRKVRAELLFAGYGLVTTLLLLSIFVWRNFPVAFVDDVGLTPFKLVSEHIIIVIFAAALYLLHRFRDAVDPDVMQLFSVSIVINIISELAFTQYVNVYDYANMIGHFLMLVAFYFIYKAIVETGIVRPFNLMFRDLVEQREALRAARDELELRVQERTSELLVANRVLVEEIQERKRMEAELAEVKSRQIDSSELERLQLAQELHDGPMQDLYGLTYQLELLRDGLPHDERDALLKSTKSTVEEVITSLRATSGELRPPTLTAFGLEKAIRSHYQNFTRAQPNLEIVLDLDKDGQALNERTRLALFRIYQVALTNVIRHANAKRVDICLRLTGDTVVLSIQDDGNGFELPKRWVELARGGHMGLVGAKERAEASGGTLEIETAPGKGTLVRVTLPREVSNEPARIPEQENESSL